jgi:hypothetical protein
MSEPKPASAWSVWHPKHEWGLTIPMLYPSEEVAIFKLKQACVWPLKDGWRLIPVLVTPTVIPPADHQPTEKTEASQS